jgi:pimeloyl-ACP methyl ester carboxylesterase
MFIFKKSSTHQLAFMRKVVYFLLILLIGFTKVNAQQDLQWTTESPAGFMELQLPSAGSLLQGFMYKANGSKPHPTLLLLHGYPGNERNLDLAQAVRAHGWNVIYFNYRGSWGSQGEFSFRHCVEDVKNVIAYCKANAVKMQIDPNRIALFGHSMGGFVCLKALQENPDIQKGFALSVWDIYQNITQASKTNQLAAQEKEADNYFVLNKKSGKALFAAVLAEADFHNLQNAAQALSVKQVVMLDEHHRNEALANKLKTANHNYFTYDVWDTDHSFTNKRASLIKKVIAFLDR